MTRMPADHELEQYLAGTAPADVMQHIEATLSSSPDLRARLTELEKEQQIVEEVKDSLAIRLPDREEERIISKSVDRIRTTLTDGGQCNV